MVQLAGLLFDTLHLLVYAFDGEGNEGINIAGDLFNILAQVRAVIPEVCAAAH